MKESSQNSEVRRQKLEYESWVPGLQIMHIF
jgi:hypothetical protein